MNRFVIAFILSLIYAITGVVGEKVYPIYLSYIPFIFYSECLKRVSYFIC